MNAASGHKKRAVGGMYVILAFMVLVNFAFWTQSRDARTQWGNVPPVPSERSASMAMLGDTQMAYRVYGLMLQNLGDIGGRITGFEKYNYNGLRDWFFLGDQLDSTSHFISVFG